MHEMKLKLIHLQFVAFTATEPVGTQNPNRNNPLTIVAFIACDNFGRCYSGTLVFNGNRLMLQFNENVGPLTDCRQIFFQSDIKVLVLEPLIKQQFAFLMIRSLTAFQCRTLTFRTMGKMWYCFGPCLYDDRFLTRWTKKLCLFFQY